MTQLPGDPQFIITTQSGSEPYAANELARAGLHFAAWLEPGVGLFRAFAPSVDAHAAPRRRPPVFVRHLFAVHAACPLMDDESAGAAPAARLRAAALTLAPRLSPERAFSVQIRAAADSPLSPDKGALARALVAELERRGYRQDARYPDDVLSIYCAADTAYLGVSPVADNVSAWNGGMRRFATRPEQISRAEFKLLEAMEVFAVDLPDSGIALDLGAAPGGWTRLLRERGFRVVAVDPADLDPRLAGDPGIDHRRTLAQIFLPDAGLFDVIVNDIRMDAMASAGLMVRAAAHLAPGGLAVVTLKLPATGQQRIVARALARLGVAYTIVGARQLFNNRAEVTVCLRPRA